MGSGQGVVGPGFSGVRVGTNEWAVVRGRSMGQGVGIITINVPLFKKLRDIIFFWWDNHFMSHFEGHFEGAKTFLTP